MITYANAQAKEAVYQLWKLLFAHDDGGYTDYYFQHLYRDAITYVYKVDGEVVATLQRRCHSFVFDEQLVLASMILGVATAPAHQGKGYMRALMNKALEDARKVEPVTMIQAYHPEIYEPFGFAPYYYSKEIDYQPKSCKVQGTLGDIDCLQCVILYQTMMKQYNGYRVRDETYFQNFQRELMAQGYSILGYYEAGWMQAYAVIEAGTSLLVSECVGSAAACEAMLALIYQTYGAFHYRVSSMDKTDTIDTLLLFHDWKGMKQHLQTTACNPEVYFDSLKKPLFLHECA